MTCYLLFYGIVCIDITIQLYFQVVVGLLACCLAYFLPSGVNMTELALLSLTAKAIGKLAS